jgi:hypothetical protein
VTVIHVNDDRTCVEEERLNVNIAKYEELDDVFHVDFLSGVMFTRSPKTEFTPGAYQLLQFLGTK